MPAFRCPTCDKWTRVLHREDAHHRPFCSFRCQMIDLHKWFQGEYRISQPLEVLDGAEEPPVRTDFDT